MAARVAALEAASGARKTKRRKAGQAKLESAVGAIIGGLLRRWSRDAPQAVFRPSTPGSFTRAPVGSRQFAAAVDGLVACGLVHRAKSIRYLTFDWGDGQTVFDGKAPRYWPALALLDVATDNGITPATLAASFRDVIPTKPPEVKEGLNKSQPAGNP